MTEVTAATVIAELYAQWNTGVIAAPKIMEGDLGKPVQGTPTIFVNFNNQGNGYNNVALNNSAAITRINWQIEIIAKNQTDLENCDNEVRRIHLAKSITGGWWGISNGPIPLNIDNHKRHVWMFYEEKFVIGSL